MAKVHVKCDGTKAVYRNYNACCSNATFIQPRLYHFWLQVFSVLRQTLSPTASLIVRVFQTSPVRPYGAGGGGCGGDGDGDGGSSSISSSVGGSSSCGGSIIVVVVL